MKKLLFTAIILSTAFVCHSQTFGIKAGVNFSGFTGSDADGFGRMAGFHAGVHKEFVVFDELSIQPELIFSMQGADIEGTEEEHKLDYLLLPVIVKYYIVDKFNIHLGPQAGYLINESETGAGAESDKFDFSVVGGLEYEITKTFFIQGRYCLGLTDLTDDADIKNSVIQASVGLKF